MSRFLKGFIFLRNAELQLVLRESSTGKERLRGELRSDGRGDMDGPKRSELDSLSVVTGEAPGRLGVDVNGRT